MPDFVLDTVFNNPVLPVVPVYGFADDFNRADGPLGVTSREGKTWTHIAVGASTVGGVIAANRAINDAVGTGTALEVVDAYSPDGVLTVTLAAVGSRQIGIAFRVAGATSYFRLVLRTSSTDFHYQLRRVGGAGDAILATAAATSAAGDVIQIALSGTTITVRVNGSVIIGPLTVADFATATAHGLWLSGGATGAAFDAISYDVDI